ncbi:hypothetical protein [Arthrobacter sp. AL12]|uniref:hypothetical protein n=1 Tax=Arthrobacter sp. AL12 TaxID=3042241 RepID=UPI00249AD0D5|nr:hypothetical protein [Arthrobacter sp. AL12]MDI3211717.1 hypothetical protein [Arthrobacter sp. AL12]
MKTGPAGLAAAMLLAVANAGCSGPVPNACPAIAWFNTLTVSLDGSVEKVSLVEFCAEGVCSIRADGPVPAPGTSLTPGTVPAPATTLAVTPAPSRSVPDYSPFTAARVDDRTWRVSLMMRSPKTVTIRAYSADGSVLAGRDVEPGWTRVGGSEACGGPETAGPVRLQIQAIKR